MRNPSTFFLAVGLLLMAILGCRSITQPKPYSALMKFGKKDSVVTQLAPSINHTLDFIIDDANVYYYDHVPNTGSFGPDALRKIPKAGGESIELDQGNSAWGKYLAVDSKQIYFTDISKVYALAK